MKTIIKTLSILLVTNSCFSQFTFTYQQAYHPYDNSFQNICDTTNFSEGLSGANVTWDFLNLQIKYFAAIPVEYLPNPVANQCTMPVNANLYTYLITGGGSMSNSYFDYFRSDSTKFSVLGACNYIYSYGNDISVYSDPPIDLIFPFHYLQTFNDTFSGSRQNYGGTSILSGNSVQKYDGWGLLKLPWGTYSNAARLKAVSYSKDTMLTGDVFISNDTVFSWWDLNTHGAILYFMKTTMVEISSTGSQTTSVLKGLYAYTDTSISRLGVFEQTPLLTNLKIYPNPSNGVFFIEIPAQLKNDRDLTLSVYDFMGNLVKQSIVGLKENVIRIDLNSEAKGIYTTILSGNQKTFTSKIIVE